MRWSCVSLSPVNPSPFLYPEVFLLETYSLEFLVRGEAANHGIIDVSSLLSRLGPYFNGSSSSSSMADLVSAYEAEMVKRTRPGVMASRRACLDAHDYKRIDEKSPLVSRRAVVPDDVEVSGSRPN